MNDLFNVVNRLRMCKQELILSGSRKAAPVSLDTLKPAV